MLGNGWKTVCGTLVFTHAEIINSLSSLSSTLVEGKRTKDEVD
jgi:hypothetical protein